MVKTTIYLPEELKSALTRSAARRAVSEAELIREALQEKIAREPERRPRVPLFPRGLGDPTAAERVDELLHDFAS